MGRAQPRDRDLAGAARWHARCGFLCRGKRGRRSWHGIQLLALLAFENRTIALIMRFDDRWRHLLGAAFICCARKTYAAAEIQGLARLKRGHARDLAIRKSGDERRRNHPCGWLAHGILPIDRRLARFAAHEHPKREHRTRPCSRARLPPAAAREVLPLGNFQKRSRPAPFDARRRQLLLHPAFTRGAAPGSIDFDQVMARWIASHIRSTPTR